jgi:carboxyl-terminal processing protease
MLHPFKALTLSLCLSLLLAGMPALAVPAATTANSQENAEEKAGHKALTPSAHHFLLDTMIIGFLQNYHLRDHEFDTELAQRVFDDFIDNLDPGRYYLLRQDVEEFRSRHAELASNNREAGAGRRVAIAFELFERYRERLLERVAFARDFLGEKPDLEADDSLEIDRSDAAWAVDRKELDRLWEKRIKNDVIGLMLAERDWETIQDTLDRRYRNFERRISQNSAEDIYEMFINAHARALDPHTAYMSARGTEEFEIRMSLSLEGIGAALVAEDDYVTITRVLPGGPADRDGRLRAQDRITGVAQGKDGDMKDVVGWRVDDVVALIRGPEGTVVRLQILPADAVPGDPEKTITLTRSEVKLEEQAASSEIITVEMDGGEQRIGIIDIPTFYMDFQGRREGKQDYRSTTRDVRRLLEELKEKQVDAVLLDLRNNGGGSLTEATDLMGLFIDRGPVVQLLDLSGDINIGHSPSGNLVWDGPMGVLINRFSASASEIVAGAIQDYGRGLVIGSPTYGKGTVQNLQDFGRHFREEDKVGQLKFTTGKFYRISGGSTQHRGVRPDIDLPSPVDLGEFGESTKPNALEWDEIRSIEHRGGPLPRKLIDSLSGHHKDRTARDIEFSAYLEELQRYQEFRQRDRISLVLEKRREERDEMQERRLARENLERTARGEEPLEALDENAETEETDLLLKESANIMADFIRLLPKLGEGRDRLAIRG